MNPGDDEDRDARLSDRLAAYDEALAAGKPNSTGDDLFPTLSSEDADDLRADQDCLNLLEQLWPRRPALAETSALLERLGRFHIVRELGRGGFGIVYLADDPLLRRQVALKVPHPGALLTPALRQRFQREAHAAARLDHPNLVPVFEAGEDGPLCYLVAAYCEGVTLRRWLDERAEPVPVRDAAQLVAALADGVAYMHSRGVCHRDIKPSNVLLAMSSSGVTDPGCPRLTDFGLAKVWEEGAEQTRSGMLLGTPLYMAPEQVEGRHADIGPATDIHALGVLLYELLTGSSPFRGPTDADTLRRVGAEEAAPPRQLRRDLPRDLEAVCLKCLEKQPGQRYSSSEALADDLRRFLAGLPTRARPLGAWSRAVRWRRRHPATAALSAVVGLSLLALVGGFCWYQGQMHSYDDALGAGAGRERAAATAAEEERARTARLHAYAASVHLAASLRAEWKQQAAVDVLATHFPTPGGEDLRGFEWHFLWRQVSGPRRLLIPQSRIDDLAFSADGRVCASASLDAMQLWEVRSGRLLVHHPDFAQGRLWWPRFSRDGGRLAARVGDQVVVWDTATGRSLAQRSAGNIEPYAAAVSADGRQVALGGCLAAPVVRDGPDHTALVRIWDTASGHESVVWKRRQPHSNVTAVCFAPGGGSLAVGYHSDAMLTDLVDLASGERRTTLAVGGFVYALAFSPDGALLASASSGVDGTVRVCEVATGREKPAFEVKQPVTALAFAPDGSTPAVGTSPWRDWKEPDALACGVTLWDVASGRRREPHLRPGCGVFSLRYAPDDRTLAVGCADGAVRLWQPESRPAFVSLPGHQPQEAWAVAFTPDGRTLVSAGDDHAVRLWDVTSGKQRAALQGHEQLVSCVAVSPDGRRIASGSYDSTVKVWDAVAGKVLFTARHGGHVRRVAFSPDGRLLASGGRDMNFRVWDAATGAEVATQALREGPELVVTFVGPRTLASNGEDGTVRLWDVDSGQTLQTLRADSGVYCLAVSPDGKVLAAGTKGGLVKLWEADTGRELRVLRGHKQDGVRWVAFSPDGKTLASAGEDKSVRLWQAATGLEVLAFEDLPHFINGVAFSPDGEHLAAALHDGTVRIWDARD